MKAIILSGGRGKRLRPITDYVPKPLVPIDNVPILEWQIKYLKKFGIKDVILSTGYKYDQIENFQYEQKTNSMSYSMPFDWSENNINQTSIVHEEIVISKTFGDLMVESLSVYVNGVEIADYSITLDGFSEHTRIIHVIVNQKDLFELYQNYEFQDEMEFLIKPSDENLPLSTMTGNGQFRIKLNWEPHDTKSGSDITLFFCKLKFIAKIH